MNNDIQPASPSDPAQNQQSPDSIDYSKPVAYDTNGQPLYARPPTSQQLQPPQDNPSKPQIVQLTRPMEPTAPHISAEALERHRQSMKAFPFLNLSEGEYVISAVKRHPIGLLGIVGAGSIIILILLLMAAFYAQYTESSFGASLPSVSVIGLVVFLVSALVGVITLIAVYIYASNKFFLTNESVIQEIQHSLFAKHEQTVSLANIEDASYQQVGLLQHIINYGSIRLSTEGDETTYRFTYVSNPKKQIAILNNAVEAFKNGRPVEDN